MSMISSSKLWISLDKNSYLKSRAASWDPYRPKVSLKMPLSRENKSIPAEKLYYSKNISHGSNQSFNSKLKKAVLAKSFTSYSLISLINGEFKLCHKSRAVLNLEKD